MVYANKGMSENAEVNVENHDDDAVVEDDAKENEAGTKY